MRALILVAVAALAGSLPLTGCRNNDQVDNTQNVDENLAAENIVSNDVTAIDAVTGDAANMAAEANLDDLGNVSNDEGNASAFPKAKPQTVSPSASGPKPAPQPASNSISNATDNAE